MSQVREKSKSTSTQRVFHVRCLGRVGYAETHALQKQLVEERAAGSVGDTVLLLEHRPVITLGRSAKWAHVLGSKAVIEAKGVEVHEVGRGGDVTYHGPGQLVGYPIIDLKPDRQDVRRYVWTLEETMIGLAADYGVNATRIQGLNGAWVNGKKIGAVGVRLSRWVTMHGFAFNNSTQLDHFQMIVPCGIADKSVTSLKEETGQDIPMHALAQAAAHHFARLYDADVVWVNACPSG